MKGPSPGLGPGDTKEEMTFFSELRKFTVLDRRWGGCQTHKQNNVVDDIIDIQRILEREGEREEYIHTFIYDP